MSTTPVPAPQSPAPRKTGPWLWWILGFAGAAMVLLVVGVLVVAGLFVRNVRVNSRAHKVEVQTPAGDLAVTRSPEKDTGLPVYPGATRAESDRGVELSLPEDQALGIIAAKYRTSDPVDRVDSWYRARLGPEFQRDAGDEEGKINVHGVKTEGVAYVADAGDGCAWRSLAGKVRERRSCLCAWACARRSSPGARCLQGPGNKKQRGLPAYRKAAVG